MRKPGFTLVELLVVIAVIALLLGLLMPALHTARENSKSVFCASNIKQLTYIFTCYSLDCNYYPPGFDDTFPLNNIPPPGGYVGESPDDKMGWWWFHFISGYMGKNESYKDIIRCPSRKIRAASVMDNVLCGNYGVNQSLCKAVRISQIFPEFTGSPITPGRLSSPSETLLLADCGYGMVNWWHVTNAPPTTLPPTRENSAYIPGMEINDSKIIWPGHKEDSLKGRQLNRSVNVGFADGRVARQPADSLFVKKVDGEPYRSLFPLWQPR